MLHHLLDIAGDSEPGFASREIRWRVDLSPKGELLGVLPLGDGKRGERHEKVPEMHNMNAGGKSHFLVETAQTVALHFKGDEADEKRKASKDKHVYFTSLIEQASKQAPVLENLSSFLKDSGSVQKLREEFSNKGTKPSDWVKFYIGGKDSLVDQNALDWWRKWRLTDLAGEEGKESLGLSYIDLLTGRNIEPAKTHPKIKGLMSVGGLPTGDVLAGFDKEAFGSYGLEQSSNAAMDEVTARKYADALNRLIADSKTKFAKTLVVHWFKEKLEEPDDDPLSWLDGRQDHFSAQIRARELLEAIQIGKRPDLAGNHFYALTLSGASGRVMFREWMEGGFKSLLENINSWFDDLSIVEREGGGFAREPKFLAVAGSLVRDLDELHPGILVPLWRAALRRTAIPNAILTQATLRARLNVIKDEPANHARMGLIKAYFIRKGGNHGMNPYLNPDHPEPAYHCGRLIAVLASLQRAALGDVGAGVVQRYYIAASQTPALIIGRLIGNAKNHLGKLEGGLPYWYEGKIAEIMSRLGDRAPRTLDLEHQSLFALGYYQQMANDRANQSKSSKNEGEQS